MAVYTHLENDEIAELLAEYDLGTLRFAVGITQGVSNSNYLLELEHNGAPIKYILTLFEQMVDEKDLPFFMQLKEHLHKKDIACPQPMRRKDGELLSDVKGRKGVIVSFLEGRARTRISPAMCESLGAAMAKLHMAGARFKMARPNALSLDGWERMITQEGHQLDTIAPELFTELQAEFNHLKEHWSSDLPAGVIHADLFPDNVFFEGEAVSGIIDFYFACNDLFAYDIAICLNCWCFEHGAEFNITKAKALLRGYQSVRPFTLPETAALPLLARGAALRFLLTRAVDWLHPAPGAQVRPKDPMEYVKKLRFHQAIKDASGYGL